MKTELEKDALNESKGAWREAAYTSYLKAEVKRNIEIRLDYLFGKCSTTTDPVVATAYGMLVAAKAQLRLLDTGEA